MSNDTPRHWYNVVPYIEKELGLEVPPLLDPQTGEPMDWQKLAQTLPSELAKIELGEGRYKTDKLIEIPEQVRAHYESYRPAPLVRATGLEKEIGVEGVKLFYKREDANEIGSYKLNSSYPQAYYASQDGAKEIIADTGPGNWGLGMAVAAKKYGIPLTIYMERTNYEKKMEKVRAMERAGAVVKAIETLQGTIAASISVALQHVHAHPQNKLSLGCLAAYSALHNTIIGMELRTQLERLGIEPDALVGVVGGGSSFSGLAFPFVKDHERTQLIAVESASVPSFTKGEYRYENPDTVGLMPRAKMYTLGNQFVPQNLGASGLNYHGKNPLLSLLVHQGIVRVQAYQNEVVDQLQELFERTEGIRPAPESCYAIKGAIETAKQFDGQDKTVIFTLTGNAHSLDI